MSKLDTERFKQSARVFWKNFKWLGFIMLLFILCDILGDGFRPILNESRTAQVIVEDNWTKAIDSLYSFFEVVSTLVMLATVAGLLLVLLIVGLVSAVRRTFFKIK